MSSDTLILTPEFDSSLVLVSEEDTSSVTLDGGADLVLELSPLIVIGDAVSGPDIYAFAAAYG